MWAVCFVDSASATSFISPTRLLAAAMIWLVSCFASVRIFSASDLPFSLISFCFQSHCLLRVF
jgi:hypothetical protein